MIVEIFDMMPLNSTHVVIEWKYSTLSKLRTYEIDYLSREDFKFNVIDTDTNNTFNVTEFNLDLPERFYFHLSANVDRYSGKKSIGNTLQWEATSSRTNHHKRKYVIII